MISNCLKTHLKKSWIHHSSYSKKLINKNKNLYLPFHHFIRNQNNSNFNKISSSRYQVRWIFNGKDNNNKSITKGNNNKDEIITDSSKQIMENVQNTISDIFTSFKSDLKHILWTIIKSGTMGSVAGIIIGSGIFIFSLKSMTLLAISFAATTLLMTSLGIVKGISRVTDNITSKDGSFYRLLSVVLDFAFEPLKKSSIGDQVIPIDDYNNAVKSTLREIEDKLSFGNWFAKIIVKFFTSKIEASFTKFTEGKDNVSLADSKDVIISIILEEIEMLLGGRISLAIYTISLSQFLIIFLSFV